VELLAAIAVVATLAALITVGSSRLVDKARATKCAGNLRQLGTATLLYATDNSMCLPVTAHQQNDVRFIGIKKWTVSLQEYAGGKVVFRCPMDEIRRDYTYVLNDFLTPSSGLEYWRLSRLEKPSKTFLFAEAARTYANSDHYHFADYKGYVIPPAVFTQQVGVSRHQGAANYVFADGHMESLRWTHVQTLLKNPTEQFVEPLNSNQPN